MGVKATTTIKIKKTTHERLTEIGNKGETFDDIIIRALDELDLLRLNNLLSDEENDDLDDGED